MKKIISKFSDKLLSKQQLKTVKGGATPYCFCLNPHTPVNCPPGVPFGTVLQPGQGGCGY
ncbi:hypothetical protein [Ulvibacterium sp.]|uniref:hypothetical protein n=1 Tax=Ulvibacterium sp. TaxID=2665914 RepID=UPI003CC55DD8